MIIKNGIVFQDNKSFTKKDIYINNGIIISDSMPLSDDSIIDAEGLFVLPGLIDIHSHGAAGFDFSDGDVKGLENILNYECVHGITSYCPTTMSLPPDKLIQILGTVKNWQNKEHHTQIIGIHMEGPFLDKSKKGAHNSDYLIEPDYNFFKECNTASGNRIKIITMSPNFIESIPFIHQLDNEIIVSLGHTDADYEISKRVLETNVNHITHLFNAMNPFEHRAPGLVGAASEKNNCYAELICDGIHVHESMIRAAFKLFPDRIVLISDSMRATGLLDNTYELGSQQITVHGKKATLKDGTIAGSVTNLYDCMCNAVSFGISKEDAIAAATMNPAKSIGIYHSVGSITPGKKAHLLLVDQNFVLKKVIC